MACVSDEQQHPIGAAIALLQCELPIESLRISGSRLRLDAADGCMAANWAGEPTDDRVPGAKIAGSRKRHLGLPDKRRVQSSSQALEQARVTFVPNWVRDRIELERGLQSEDRRDPAEHRQGYAWRAASFDPAVLRARDPERGRDLLL